LYRDETNKKKKALTINILYQEVPSHRIKYCYRTHYKERQPKAAYLEIYKIILLEFELVSAESHMKTLQTAMNIFLTRVKELHDVHSQFPSTGEIPLNIFRIGRYKAEPLELLFNSVIC
jgi:hypothetical protein